MRIAWEPSGEDYERVPDDERRQVARSHTGRVLSESEEWARYRNNVLCHYSVIKPSQYRPYKEGHIVVEAVAVAPPRRLFGNTIAGTLRLTIFGNDERAVENAKAALDEMESALMRLRSMQHELWGGFPSRRVGRS